MELKLRAEGFQTLSTPEKTVPKAPDKKVSSEVKGEQNGIRKDDKN